MEQKIIYLTIKQITTPEQDKTLLFFGSLANEGHH